MTTVNKTAIWKLHYDSNNNLERKHDMPCFQNNSSYTWKRRNCDYTTAIPISFNEEYHFIYVRDCKIYKDGRMSSPINYSALVITRLPPFNDFEYITIRVSVKPYCGQCLIAEAIASLDPERYRN